MVERQAIASSETRGKPSVVSKSAGWIPATGWFSGDAVPSIGPGSHATLPRIRAGNGFRCADCAGMETGKPRRSSGGARVLGSPPQVIRPVKALIRSGAGTPRARPAFFRRVPGNHSHRDSNVLKRCGCLPHFCRPPSTRASFSRLSRSSTWGLGLLASRGPSRWWWSSGAQQPVLGPVLALRPAACWLASMNVLMTIGEVQSHFQSLHRRCHVYTGATKASKNGVRCGQVQKAWKIQANPAGHRLSVIVCLSPNSPVLLGFFALEDTGNTGAY